MRKLIALAILGLPGLCLGATFSIDIKNDPEVTQFLTGKPGPWLFRTSLPQSDTLITCDGAPCPDQINENQTITFTVTSQTAEQNLGFHVTFTSAPFVLADDVCFITENYWIPSGPTPPSGNQMTISKAPPNGGILQSMVDCDPAK